MKAIRVHELGGPEVLRLEQIPSPQPGSGDVLVELRAIGVNFIDTYHRQGLYKLPIPFTPGVEGAGVVTSVAPDVNQFKPGDRVVYALSPGAYAEQAAVPAAKLVRLPAQLDFEAGAAATLQGLTAHYLTRSTFVLQPGHAVLVHAAAGGVGLLLVQVAKLLGATVFGTVSTEEKAELAREAGADHVILYTKQDFEAEVRRLTSGKGVDVVYESVGRDTFDKSLNSLKPRGFLILYGQASGPVPPLDPQVLNAKGSLFLTRPSLGHYTASREELDARAEELFGWIAQGRVKLRIGVRYQLENAAQAHRDLEARKTTGKVVLVP
ncbi:MAG: quinone oxidoreductase [Acidobacteria bacterium]|nr:MAG: quinone oxidoreductase [Acidobacteriota bacterium]